MNNNNFERPTTKEIINYIKEKELYIDASKFWNYYNAKDWKDKKGNFINWRSVAESWHKHERFRQEQKAEEQLKEDEKYLIDYDINLFDSEVYKKWKEDKQRNGIRIKRLNDKYFSELADLHNEKIINDYKKSVIAGRKDETILNKILGYDCEYSIYNKPKEIKKYLLEVWSPEEVLDPKYEERKNYYMNLNYFKFYAFEDEPEELEPEERIKREEERTKQLIKNTKGGHSYAEDWARFNQLKAGWNEEENIRMNKKIKRILNEIEAEEMKEAKARSF